MSKKWGPLHTKVGRSIRLSERLTFHPDDARAYIQKTDQKFDLIVYSILDSHTTSSYYTNIRLDNYVYTLESMRRTRELLKPNGVFVLSFSSECPWFAGRMPSRTWAP